MFTITANIKFLPALWLRNSSGSRHRDWARRYLKLNRTHKRKTPAAPTSPDPITHTHTHTLQHPPICVCHYVHTQGSAPGTVRVPGKDAVVAGSVSAAVREGKLHHAGWGAHVHTHLEGERERFNTAGRRRLLKCVCACDGKHATCFADISRLLTGSGSSNSWSSSIMCSWPSTSTALCNQPSSEWRIQRSETLKDHNNMQYDQLNLICISVCLS